MLKGKMTSLKNKYYGEAPEKAVKTKAPKADQKVETKSNKPNKSK
jgi:hypothetical protein